MEYTDARPSGHTFVALAKQSVEAWMDDYAASMGAALSYYTLFSLAPLLLIVVAVAGLVFNTQTARDQLLAQIGGLVGPEGSFVIDGLLKSASHPGQSLFASIAGVVTLIVGATSVFAELQSDLDRIWRAPVTVRPSGLRGLLRTRLVSFGLIVSIGFLLLVSLVVSAAIHVLGAWYGAWFPGWVVTLEVVNQVVSLAVVTALFALMYRILPSVHVAWQDVWRGSFVTALLFTAGKYLIGLYLGRAGISSSFGAAGSLVVLMVWVFYSAQIFLLGAEYTWLEAQHRASVSREHEPGGEDGAAEDRSTDEVRPVDPLVHDPAHSMHNGRAMADRPLRGEPTMEELPKTVERTMTELSDAVSDASQREINAVDVNRPAIADRLESAADSMRDQARRFSGGTVRGAWDKASDTLDQTADYVRTHSLRRMTGDVESFVKNNPFASIAVAAVVGMMVGRAINRH
jgi:membrane protein